jgi:nucleoside diphosphate kinase
MDTWLPTLKTDTPEAGYDLAVKMARVAIKKTQPDDAARAALRPKYANDASDLIAVSHVVAVNFATIAAANDYWKAEA